MAGFYAVVLAETSPNHDAAADVEVLREHLAVGKSICEPVNGLSHVVKVRGAGVERRQGIGKSLPGVVVVDLVAQGSLLQRDVVGLRIVDALLQRPHRLRPRMKGNNEQDNVNVSQHGT